MKKVIPVKKHLLVKRSKIMKFLISEGYSMTDIGIMFNINKSNVSRILASSEKYKGLVKTMLEK